MKTLGLFRVRPLSLLVQPLNGHRAKLISADKDLELLVLKRKTLQYEVESQSRDGKNKKKRKIPGFLAGFFPPLCSLWLLHLQFSRDVMTAEFTFKAEGNTRSCANIQPTHEVVMWLHYEFSTVYTRVMCMLKFLFFPSKTKSGFSFQYF